MNTVRKMSKKALKRHGYNSEKQHQHNGDFRKVLGWKSGLRPAEAARL